ncbi:MAG: FAD-dependent oxidoreductase, partial [Candidatus Bipolaricaulia bacterium]
MKKFDLIILGGGAAAEHGAETGMVNEGLPLGGTCVNVGCVPTKHLLEVGNHYYSANHSRFKAIRTDGSSIDFGAAIAEKDELIAGLRQQNYRDVLGSMATVTLYEGRGRFISPRKVEVDGQVLTGERFIIATGSSPQIVPFKGIEQVDYLTNREALVLKTLPKSLIIIGAGPVGMEFAQLFAHFGTEVTVLARGPRVLRREEPEVSEELQRCL